MNRYYTTYSTPVQILLEMIAVFSAALEIAFGSDALQRFCGLRVQHFRSTIKRAIPSAPPGLP